MQGAAHYNYYRDYDPDTGRYLQPDPIGLAGGLNLYGYAYDNPLRYLDPDGQIPGVPGAAIGAGTNLAFQIALHLQDGRSLSQAIKCIDLVAVAVAGGVGALTPGLGQSTRDVARYFSGKISGTSLVNNSLGPFIGLGVPYKFALNLGIPDLRIKELLPKDPCDKDDCKLKFAPEVLKDLIH